MKMNDIFRCPFCGYVGQLELMGADRFPVLKDLKVIGAGRRAARCAVCASTDKERLVYVFLNYMEQLNSKTNVSILHIAPEKNLQRWLETISNKYIAGDAFLQNQEFDGKVRYVNICHTDFSDLETIGRTHYMNTHGGCASAEDLDNLDGTETAILLIEDNEGTITRYGVVYDNGMQLSHIYDGRNLPCYHYDNDIISVGLASRSGPDNPTDIAWVYLPASNGQIERAMHRARINDPADLSLWMGDSLFPMEIDVALDFRHEDIYDLNELAEAVKKLSNDDRMKLGAVVGMAQPKYASQICRLAENLDLFEFAPGAHTPAEYGKFMIQQSGHFDYDPNLDEFYDYERYGRQHMDSESGMFTDHGYIAYVGVETLEELMGEGQEQVKGVMEMQ